MAKDKLMYVCEQCGHEASQWLGKCPMCGAWNSYKEIRVEPLPTKSPSAKSGAKGQMRVRPLREVKRSKEERIVTPDRELNRVLGGGFVKGSVVLVGGEPGVGKSTLLLQTALHLGGKVVYVSGEESESQIKMRADRLAEAQGSELPEGLHILCETSLESIYEQLSLVEPDLVIIDSIQTIYTGDGEAQQGGPAQIKGCAVSLLHYAKNTGTSVLIVGHITKEGSLAGPKLLEHVVDVVLRFEGDRRFGFRVLRSLKNRFGSTLELGVYEMSGAGLRAVDDASGLLSTASNRGLSGVAVASVVEGVRPFLIETQALVSTAAYGVPQRVTTGFDGRRLNMLLAVLEKRVGFKLMQKDVFISIAGGLKVLDIGIDLSVIIAVLSSNVDMKVPHGLCFTGEVGLSGEIRSVVRLSERAREAERLGFETILVPEIGLRGLDRKGLNINIRPVAKVEDALRLVFG